MSKHFLYITVNGLPIATVTASLRVTLELCVVHVFSHGWFVPVRRKTMGWLDEVHLLLGIGRVHPRFVWVLTGHVSWGYEGHSDDWWATKTAASNSEGELGAESLESELLIKCCRVEWYHVQWGMFDR
jgi:hypothetical protein